MLISNFNLYKTEWLDLVFDKRNKEYGAYNIRQHYAENLTRALLISVVLVVGGAIAVGKAIKVEPREIFKKTDVDNSFKYIEPPVKPELEKPKPETAPPAKPTAPVRTTQFLQMVVTPDPEATVEPPTVAQMQNTAVGPETIDAPESGTLNTPVEPASGPGGKGTEVESNVPVTIEGLSVLPTPVGGDAAWTKFLTKNLRYPDQAIDAEKSGKVWISFIIEKDGSLTDIKVIRGPGYGMDAEALRVLKKAPAWTPGIQRGKPVRVAYTLPINFSLGN
jgi:protein TonB